MPSYPNLPRVIPAEVDKSVVPAVTPQDLKLCSVIDTDWGIPELQLVERPNDLINWYTWSGVPDIGDVGWQSAYYILNQGVPIYIYRQIASGCVCSNVIFKVAAASGTAAPNASGINWATASSYTFGVSDLFAVVVYPGAHGDNYGFKLASVDSSGYSFTLEYYRKDSAGTLTLQDTFTFSRKRIKDGYGNDLYLENRIQDFQVPFKLVDNTSKLNTVLPKLSSVITCDGGSNGIASGVTAARIVLGWQAIKALEEDFRVCLALGQTDVSVATELATIATTRDYNVSVVDGVNAAVSTLTSFRGTFSVSHSRAMIGAEWHLQKDSFNNVDIYLPPSSVIGALIGRNRETDPFKPFAGLRRGTFICNGLSRMYSKTDLDTLLDKQINPLTRWGSAYVLLDNLTTQTFKSVLSNMNTRFLFDHITEVATDYLMAFIHEYNDDSTREIITDGLQRFLDTLVDSDDLIEALVICNVDNNPSAIIDAEKLVCDLYLKPPRAAKFIHVNLIAVASGVTLTIA